MKNLTPSFLLIATPILYYLAQFFLPLAPEAVSTLLPPASDDCETPSEIIIPDNGFATGVFYSDTIEIGDATIQNNEYFTVGHISAALDEKSIWFTFALPTHRELKVELKQPDLAIATNQAGFTTYFAGTGDCLPGPAEIAAALLTPVNTLGSTNNPCLRPGTYLVQVSAHTEADGPVFLELTLDKTFETSTTTDILYDMGMDAYQFGLMDTTEKEVIYNWGCHSIDSLPEYDCIPVAVPEDYLQSSWHVFTTGDYFDLLSIVVESSGGVLPDEIGLKVFAGDVTQQDISLLPLVDCVTLESFFSRRAREYFCDSLLLPNTVYSFALLFPANYENNEVKVKLCQWGEQLGAGTRPLKNDLPPTNKLGLLSPSDTLDFVDYFACNSFLADNECGTVNPATGVCCYSGNTFDMAVWTTFELEEAADVKVQLIFETNTIARRRVRIFNRQIYGDCDSLDAVTDLFWTRDYTYGFTQTIDCMPAGEYSIQVLGISQYNNNASCLNGNLGKKVEVILSALDVFDISEFALNQPLAADTINLLNPLQNGVVYESVPDTFGCGNTVMPEGTTCIGGRQKAIYRVFEIGDGDGDMQADSGLLRITNMRTPFPNYIYYRLFQDNLMYLANAQTAFSAGQQITGVNDYLDGCITYINTDSKGYYCVVPDQYSLVAYGGTDQEGREDQPSFQFRKLRTIHYSRQTAENMGSIIPQSIPECDSTLIICYPSILDCDNNMICDTITQVCDIIIQGMDTIINYSDTILSNQYFILNSEPDTFSCLDNALTIDSIEPCGEATKMIYRQFYLAESRVVTISSGTPCNLFKGKANDIGQNLTFWTGYNSDGVLWEQCKSEQRTHPCDPLTPGWYTVVTYGTGAGYDHPSYHTGSNSNNNTGMQADLGTENIVSLIIEPLPPEQYDRPFKAGVANDCEPVDWNFAESNVKCANTEIIYSPGVLDFGCIADLPWNNHAIESCELSDRYVIYYVFSITETSFVRISGIPEGIKSKIYPFDVRSDSASLITNEPVYPCASPEYGELQMCNLQAGDYTLVMFAGSGDPGSVEPVIHVEKVGYSRFDHAIDAYDFGIVPTNNTTIYGKPGDVHPLDPNLVPSNDIFYCTTGAQPEDPIEGVCCIEYNPNIYALNTNNPLYLDSFPSIADGQNHSLRNLWYTFVLTGSGNARVDLTHCSPASSSNRPAMAIYESDVDGTINFSDLVLNGGVDSTDFDGLSLVKHNMSGASCFYCTYSRSGNVNFQKNGCLRDTVRYYALVSQWNNTDPNQQVELSIRYNGVPSSTAQFDYYSTADTIGNSPLNEGVHYGEAMTLECATRSALDPYNNDCYDRSVWYTFELESSGYIYWAFERMTNNWRYYSTNLVLYRETISGDSINLVEIPNTVGNFSDPDYTYNHNWLKACYSPGTYYIFWRNCFSTFDNFTEYRPIIWIDRHPGDFCEDAIELSLNGVGSDADTVLVDCHTIGGDFGEDGSNMDCLNGPEGFKSSWFKLNINTMEKLDINFQMSNFTDAFASEITYRVLYGDCSAMNSGPCNSSSNTEFTVNCFTEGDYYVQVVSPIDAEGEIELIVNAYLSANQECTPDTCIAKATFTQIISCDQDTVEFINLSTEGDSILYEWTFLPGWTNSEEDPHIVFPRNDTIQYIPVQLITLNLKQNCADTISKIITIPPYLEAFGIEDSTQCNGESLEINLDLNTDIVNVEWGDPYVGLSRTITESGTYIVNMEVPDLGCIVSDTLVYVQQPCTTYVNSYVDLCLGTMYGGEFYTQDTILLESTFDAFDNITIDSITIEVADTFYFLIDTIICDGEAFLFEGTNYSEPVQICLTYSSVAACDSTYCLNLGVTETPLSEFSDEFCHDEAYIYNGQTYDSTGTYTISFATATGGCDSLVMLHLTELPPVDTTYNFNITCNSAEANTSVVIASDINGCDSVVVTTTSYFPIEVEINLENTSCDSTNGSIFLAISGQSGPYDILWNTSDTAALIDSIPAGTYRATITDTNACTQVIETTITAETSLEITLDAVPANCNLSLGSAGVSASGGDENYSYDWGSYGTTAMIEELPPGFYTVTVTDGTGCARIDSIEIMLENDFTAELTAESISCNGMSDGMAAVSNLDTFNYTFLWNTTTMSEYAEVTGLSAGEYSITVTDDIGCTTVSTIEITEPEILLANVSGIDGPCSGEGSALAENISGGVPGYTFLWNYNDETTSTITGLADGTYVVTVTDNNGCTFSETVFIENPAELMAEFEQQAVSCHEGTDGSVSAMPEGGTAPYSYNWSNDSTEASLDNLPEGLYTLTVTDANGCQFVQDITVDEPSPILAEVYSDVGSCSEQGSAGVMNISGGTPGYSILWSNNDTNSIITDLTDDFYSVTVTDLNGCTFSETVSIENPLELGLGIIEQDISCFDAGDGSLEAIPVGGTPPYLYNWSNDSTSQSITNLEAGTYILSLTDANGCLDTVSLNIDEPDLLQAEVTGYDSPCSGEGSADVSNITGGTPGYTILWNTGATDSAINNLANGMYSVTVTDSNNCNFIETVSVETPSEATIDFVDEDITCNGSSDGSIAAMPNGGSPPYLYNWSNGFMTPLISDLAAGLYILSLTDANGCEITDSIILEEPNAIQAVVAGYDGECYEEAAASVENITGGTPGYEFLWSNGETTSTITNLPDGTYSVTMTDANGCTFSETVSVESPPILLGNLFPEHITCFSDADGSVEVEPVGGTPPYFYDWSNGETGPQIENLTAGLYTLHLTDANGCLFVSSVTVDEPESLEVDLLISPADQGDNGTAIVVPSGGTTPYEVMWSTGAIGLIVENLAVGTYSITVTDANGCTTVEAFLISLTAIERPDAIESFRVFPNPTKSNCQIELKLRRAEKVQIQVFNAQGIRLQYFEKEDILIMNQLLELSAFPAGVYFCNIKIGDFQFTEKIVVVR